jgi:Dolichyl-phosphate-mannose-protein mannosyltransferase
MSPVAQQGHRRLPAAWTLGLSLLLGFLAQLCFVLDLSVAIGAGLYLIAAYLFAQPFTAADSAAIISDKLRQSAANELPQISDRTEWLLLLALFVVASFFRLYRIESQPISLWIDETLTGLNALEIIEGKAASLWQMTPLDRWRPEWVKTSNLYLYYVVLVFKLFGTGYFGLKMVSILPAIAGVLAAYFLFKEIANRSIAFIAAFLMAVSQWHVTISRWGWDALLMSLLQLLSYYFLARGVKNRRKGDFILSGAIMGLCLYTYVAAWLALSIALAFLTLRAFRERGARNACFSDAGLFLLACLLVFAPLGAHYLSHPSDLVVRAGEVNIGNAIATEKSFAPVWDNLSKYSLMFNYRGDANARHGFPREPLLDFLTAILFVLGLAFCARFWCRWQNIFMLVWFAAGIQAGLLSDPAAAPNVYRTMMIIPAVCFFAATGAGQLWRVSLTLAPRLSKRLLLQLVLVASFLGYTTFENYSIYFVRRPTSPAVFDEEGRDRRLPARIAALRKESQIIIVDPLLLVKVVVLNTWFLTYRPGRLFEPSYVTANLLVAEAEVANRRDYAEITYVFPPVFHNLLRSLFPSAAGQIVVTPAGDAVYGILRITTEEFTAKMRSLDKNWLASIVAKIALLYESRAQAAIPEMGPSEVILRDASRDGLNFAIRLLDPKISADSLR